MKPRRRLHFLPAPGGRERADPGQRVVVVGGGIAGVAAAVVLAERGVQVILLEREARLGGRAGAWSAAMPGGERFEMERGFHAFFRQYYNLQALLRRIDPELGFLRQLSDYPILGPRGLVQSFAGLPRRTPQNLVHLTRRSGSLGWRDLLRIDKRRALEMLTFDMRRTYERWDATSAAEYLDSLRFPPDARRLLFDVFSHSFFNPEREMSAAELLMMFHFYFTGNPEGLVFDVARSPFSHCIWKPFEDLLKRHHVELRFQEEACMLRRQEVLREGAGSPWQVFTTRDQLAADGVILALPVMALQSLVRDSPHLDDPSWRRAVAAQRLTLPFAVWRLWLGGAVRAGRAPFVGTTGVGTLDNISLYHLFEDESRDWAERSGGSVVELHAYAVDPEVEEDWLRRDMLRSLHHFYPETAGTPILNECWLWRQDCPAFAPGSIEQRPSVETPHAGLMLAGDLVKLPFPSALMERAAASGFLAANVFLRGIGVRPEPLESVPERGILAGLLRG